MIDINELRQTLGAVSLEDVEELLDRLEAAEKERDNLRARIETMERQEPVAKVRVHRTGGNAGLAWSVAPLNDFDSLPLMRDGDRLYALPGAQNAPSVPDAIIKAAMEAQREGCAEVVLQAAHKAADYNNLRDYELLRELSIAVAKAPEAKP